MAGEAQRPLIGYGRTADVYRWSDTEVLKLYQAHRSAEEVDREWHSARRVQALGLPTPPVLGRRQVAGRHGIIYRRVAGPTILQQFGATPWRLFGLTRLFAALHGAIHQHSVADLPSQRERFAALIRPAKAVPATTRAAALAALESLPDGTQLCHGDFHPDQIILTPQGPVIIDWLTACRGNPLADVALTALILQVGSPPAGRISSLPVRLARRIARSRYLHRYVTITGADREQLAAWQLPIAVARLSMSFPDEAARLLPLIGKLERQHAVNTRSESR